MWRKIGREMGVYASRFAKPKRHFLFLGLSGSGKTTIIRHLDLDERGNVDSEIRAKSSNILRWRVLKRVLFLADHCLVDLSENLLSQISEIDVITYDRLLEMGNEELKNLGHQIIKIVQDTSIQSMTLLPGKSYEDNADFFVANRYLGDLELIFEEAFIPSTVDMLFIRQPTEEPLELQVLLKGPHEEETLVYLREIGGQTHLQGEWVEEFSKQNLDAIIFVVSLDDYRFESTTGEGNRLAMSASLYANILESDAMNLELPTLVIFNKLDIFGESITRTNLNVCSLFPRVQDSLEGESEKDRCDRLIATIVAHFRGIHESLRPRMRFRHLLSTAVMTDKDNRGEGCLSLTKIVNEIQG